MSLKKLVLLTALAAVAVMSMASVASANTIVTCGAGVHCPSGQKFNGTSTNARLTTTSGDINCTHSTVMGELAGASTGAPSVPIKITSVHFSGCSGTTACTEPSTITSGAVNWTGDVNGTTDVMTVNNPSVPVNLTGIFCGTCTYNAASVTGNISGSTVAFDDPMNVTSGGGWTCPGSARWIATYTVRTGTTPGAGTLVTVD